MNRHHLALKRSLLVFLLSLVGLVGLTLSLRAGGHAARAATHPLEEMATAASVMRLSALNELSVEHFGWERISGAAGPLRLYALDMVSDTLGWAVGDEGKLLRYDGSTWELEQLPAGYTLRDVLMTEPDHGWAVSEGALLRYAEGRWFVWPQQISLVNSNLRSLDMISPTLGWMVGRFGTIFAWNGTRWQLAASPTHYMLNGLDAVSSTLAVAVGDGGVIVQYDGNTWSEQSSPTTNMLNAVALYSSTEGWAVGDSGTLLHYDGASWNTVASPIADPLLAVLIVAPNDVWVSGQGGRLLHYDGTVWNSVPSPTSYSLYGLEQAPDASLWVVGYNSTVLRYSGGHWVEVTRSVVSDLHDVVWDSADGWAVGAAGHILHQSGSSWVTVTQVTTASLYAVGRSAPGGLWAIGERGTMLHYSGSNWQMEASPTTYTLRGLTFISPTLGWAVGGALRLTPPFSSAVILRYDGLSWQTHLISNALPLYATAFANAATGWAAGEGGSIWRWSGDDWIGEPSPTDRALWSLAVLTDSNVWAVGEAGTIVHYDGAAWHNVASPVDIGLHKVIMINAEEGWAWGDSGTVLHYAGQRWQQVTSPTAYRLWSGTLADNGALWAVGNNGIVLRRMPTSGDFHLSSSVIPFIVRGASMTMTLTLAAFDAYHAPVTVSLSELPSGLEADWDSLVLTPSTELPLLITSAPTVTLSTWSLKVNATDGVLTRTTAISVTALPGDWTSGARLPIERRLHAASADERGWWWVAGDAGTILRYDRSTWQELTVNTSRDLYAIAMVSSTLGWAAGADGALLRFDGTRWLAAASPTTLPLFSLVLTDATHGWAVGGEGTVLHYDGSSWQQMVTPARSWLYDADFAVDGTGWAVGWGGTIWRFDGTQWQETQSPASSWLHAVEVIDSDEAWAAGSEGTLLHYHAGQWQVVPTSIGGRLLDVQFSDPANGWLAGSDGTMLRYSSGMWIPLPQRSTADLRALALIGNDYALAVGNNGSVTCYQATGVLPLAGCGEESIALTSTLPHKFFMPLLGSQTLGGSPIDVYSVQTIGGPLSRDPAIVHQLAEAGLRWARVPFSWKLIEPTNVSADRFNWSIYDDWLELLAANDIRPLLFLSSNPTWAGILPAASLDQADDAELNAFLAVAVARYSQSPYRVTHWEIYNEPDNVSQRFAEFGWGVWGEDGADYAAELARVSPVIKAANPAAQVLLGGIAYEFFVEDGGVFARNFITAVLDAGGGNYVDFLNFHYYGADFSGRINFFKTQAVKAGEGVGLVCTEVSQAAADPAAENSGERYARYLPQAIIRGLAHGLPIVTYFSLGDMDDGWRPGLFAFDRSLRPAYFAYRTLTQMLQPARYARPLSNAEIGNAPVEGYVFDLPTGRRLDALWTTNGTVMKWRVRAAVVQVNNLYGALSIVVDGADGQVDGWTTVDVGSSPLYLSY